MNVISPEQIDLMFYNNDITATHFAYKGKYSNEMASKITKIATFVNHKISNNPVYVLKYPYLYVIL